MSLKNINIRAMVLLVSLTTLGVAPLAFAQPSNAKLVVGFTPGGPIDAVARIISTQLGQELGVNMIVENRAGANAGLAAEYVAKAEPDGRTLFLTSTGAVAISPSRLTSPIRMIPAAERISICAPIGRPLPTMYLSSKRVGIR